MNERIRELAGKALDQAVPETWTTLTASDLTKVRTEIKIDGVWTEVTVDQLDREAQNGN